MLLRIPHIFIALIVGAIAVVAQEVDSIAPQQPTRLVRSRVDLDHQVDFKAVDSMLLIGRSHAWMFGAGKVTYGDIQLDADIIDMDLNNSNVNATGALDSLGHFTSHPKFAQGGDSYDSETMSYNFKTQRGYITNVVTQQGEGFLTGGKAKRLDNGEFYIQDGKYTTCDNHDNPHFHLQITKGKVKPGSNIVTGPAYMVLAGMPLPIAVPFGYFPFSKKYSSGIIFPTFGDDYRRGFYLDNGGYYLAINDYVDLALTGQIYTKGSWGLTARSNYAVRYKFAGNFNISYLKSIDGEKGSPDYNTQTNFQLIWNHQQDAKFNPNMTLSASVNFATSGYSRKDVNSYYSNNFTENTKSSSINMSYRIPNSKWSINLGMNVSQRSSDEMLNVSLPNLSITMAQVAPFKRKKAVGNERWYEKIKLSYSGQLQNSLTAKQNEFFHKSLIKDWRNGMRHSIPISATFQLLKYINITPSISLNDRMYTQKVNRQWDPNAAAEVCDTTYSLYNVFDFNASLGLSTKLYGFWQPLGIFGKKIKMIRHVLTPTVSFSAAPDFGTPFWGYYGEYEYTTKEGQTRRQQYSKFPNAIFGVPGRGKQGALSFSLANNLEAKVKSNADSTGERKISLIENFSVSQSYNFAADSLNWSNINTSILLRLTKGFNLNLSAVWDVYTYRLNDQGIPYRCNVTRLQAGKGLGRLSSTGTSFSYNFNNDTFLKLFRRKKDKDKGSGETEKDTTKPSKKKKKDSPSGGNGSFDPDGYLQWQFPWNLSVSYSVSYGYGTFNKEKLEYNTKWTQNLSFSGSVRPTPNWNITMSASYDFNLKKIAYMNCNISRDLHCWTLTASFVPLGPYKSYNFHIAVNSSLLSDLKYDKRLSYNSGIDWY